MTLQWHNPTDEQDQLNPNINDGHMLTAELTQSMLGRLQQDCRSVLH